MSSKLLKIIFLLSLLIIVISFTTSCDKLTEEVITFDEDIEINANSSSSNSKNEDSISNTNNENDFSISNNQPSTSNSVNLGDVDFSRTGFSLDSLYPSTILPLSESNSQSYLDKIVFVGESTTYGLKSYKLIKNTDNIWTTKSGTLMLTDVNASTGKILHTDKDGLQNEMLIKDAAKVSQPEYMVITLGLTGISTFIDRNPKYYINEYEKLILSIKEVAPNTKIMIQSIFPVCSYYKNINYVSIDRINKANYLFAQLAEKLNVKFLNTATVLKNDSGYLDNSLTNGDGIHLNEQGLKKELDYIISHKYKD